MLSFESIAAIQDWYKVTCLGRRVSVLLRGQQRLIEHFGLRTTGSYVLTFNDRTY